MMRESRRIVGFWMAWAAVSVVGVSVASAQVKEVRGTGRAEGDGAAAKDAALQDAKRNALETAATLVSSSSDVANYETIRDMIITEAVGYIEECKVLKEGFDSNLGLYTVEVSAKVRLGDFERFWKERFKQLLMQIGSPRLIIVVYEDANGADSIPAVTDGPCQTLLQSFFLDHDVQLFDNAAVKEIVQRDIQVYGFLNDNNAAAAAAAKSGAELLLVANCKATPAGSKPLGETTFYQWNRILSYKIIRTGDGSIQNSNAYPRSDKPVKSTWTTMQETAEAQEALQEMVEKCAEPLLKEVADAWQKEINSRRYYDVEFSGISNEDFMNVLKPALVGMKGVDLGAQGVQQRGFFNGVVQTQIFWKMDLDSLDNAIQKLALPGMTFKVAWKDARRIKYQVEKSGP